MQCYTATSLGLTSREAASAEALKHWREARRAAQGSQNFAWFHGEQAQIRRKGICIHFVVKTRQACKYKGCVARVVTGRVITVEYDTHGDVAAAFGWRVTLQWEFVRMY
jgi:hypothetical protein